MDIVSVKKRSQMMSGIKSKNTKPEIIVRKHLYSLGYRYRINFKIFGIRPDIVLPKWKCCIFVHGCYWHQHKNCKLASSPKSNVEFWNKKFADNISRDQRNKKKIESENWTIGVIWECAVRRKIIYNIDFSKYLSSPSSWSIG